MLHSIGYAYPISSIVLFFFHYNCLFGIASNNSDMNVKFAKNSIVNVQKPNVNVRVSHYERLLDVKWLESTMYGMDEYKLFIDFWIDAIC